jgi:hypothetical protein
MTMKTMQELQAKATELQAKLNEAYPNHCDECCGIGGSISYSGATYWEPPDMDFDECSACEGSHPLDLNQPMTEEEYEVWVETILDEGHPVSLVTELDSVRNDILALAEHEFEIELTEAEERNQQEQSRLEEESYQKFWNK